MTRAFVQVGILGYVLTFLVILIKSLNKLSLSNKSFFLCILFFHRFPSKLNVVHTTIFYPINITIALHINFWMSEIGIWHMSNNSLCIVRQLS